MNTNIKVKQAPSPRHSNTFYSTTVSKTEQKGMKPSPSLFHYQFGTAEIKAIVSKGSMPYEGLINKGKTKLASPWRKNDHFNIQD